ncbi:NAD-dependent dihydropyrimidine dehydrogenase PreA subunit [Methanococcus voltae]|uniref:4Fe-4S dicluster domain-containing protein n=1 Tax=Methanococcus voltae TaxID=2188 RepID=UPI001AE22CC9|nr:4Fe-4S dicluster domain-containing protein [Methanococcus voltae]MBP2143481.1 NAD-dependent dihydropyrimidine dehydrogenase PreA subunit [Methanococcus voltae]
MVKIKIDYNFCNGLDCAECVNTCPMEIFDISEDKIVIVNQETCVWCKVCTDVCPNDCIALDFESD